MKPSYVGWIRFSTRFLRNSTAQSPIMSRHSVPRLHTQQVVVTPPYFLLIACVS